MANPHTADTPHWEAAFEHYYRDDVLRAFADIEQFGIGDGGELLRWYRVMEAEAITRRRSKVISVTDWLTLEYVPCETIGLEQILASRALEECERAAALFGWSHDEATRLTILAEETDAPWATNPFGYCVAKDPYEKICLPNYLVDDPEEFGQAVAHEYAHVITSNLGEGLAPRWLEEAVSVVVERRVDLDCWRRFCTGERAWLTPSRLEAVLIDRSDDDGTKDSIWAAYQQAGWIGRYLVECFGDQKLSLVLGELANESRSTNLSRLIRGKDRTEDALMRVLKSTPAEVFDRARQWLSTISEEAV